MKKIIGIVAACVIGIIIVIVTVISCGGTPAPTLAKDSIELEEKIQADMTLDQVYALMAPGLNKMVLPAQNIIHQPDGKWRFEPKEGGEPGDIDAPYQVLAVYPTSAEQGFYMLFFKDKQLFEDVRFEYETGIKIQKLLWTTESTD